MASRRLMTVDGNEAAASVAYRASETTAIYPITPSSPMAEVCDEWTSRKRPNLDGHSARMRTLHREIGSWMQEHESTSLNEMRGNMSLQRIPDPAAYERANFRLALR